MNLAFQVSLKKVHCEAILPGKLSILKNLDYRSDVLLLAKKILPTDI